MTERLATMTVIRGNGDCQVIVNGIVSKEIEKQQRLQRREVDALNEQLKQVTERRDKLLMADIKRRRHVTRWERIRHTFSNIRDYIALAMCMPFALAEHFGLIEIIDDTSEANRRAYLELTQAREEYLARKRMEHYE